MLNRTRALALLMLPFLFAAPLPAQAKWPEKPIKIVLPFGPGGVADVSSRILADKLSQIWGQPVVTLNQPGAGGGIAARVASQSPNDGYSLYLPSTSTFLPLESSVLPLPCTSRTAPLSHPACAPRCY